MHKLKHNLEPVKLPEEWAESESLTTCFVLHAWSRSTLVTTANTGRFDKMSDLRAPPFFSLRLST